MARAASAPKKEISMEEALWKSADKLRGSVEPAEYKHVVLSLFFLKFASDKFEAQRKAISEKYGEKFVDNVAFYTKDNVFFLPEISRWSFIMENAKQDDIALKIDTALYTIEKANPALKGALPDNYYSRLHIDTAKLASLLDEIDKINTGDKENDIIGRVYEYFLSKFALAEGKGKGEFYTPKCIVNLIAEMIEPYDGILYDPCCGSGGMFVQSMKFVEAHHGNKKKVSIYGQEYTNTTYKLCKMNIVFNIILDFILKSNPLMQKLKKKFQFLEPSLKDAGHLRSTGDALLLKGLFALCAAQMITVMVSRRSEKRINIRLDRLYFLYFFFELRTFIIEPLLLIKKSLLLRLQCLQARQFFIALHGK